MVVAVVVVVLVVAMGETANAEHHPIPNFHKHTHTQVTHAMFVVGWGRKYCAKLHYRIGSLCCVPVCVCVSLACVLVCVCAVCVCALMRFISKSCFI